MSPSVDAFGSVQKQIEFCRMVLMLMSMLGVDGAIETNVFLSSVNARVNAKVNADARCE